uniref:Aspartyl-tRNA synthetase n=1 Tax=Heterorhabditis bacteriophora TaxID=37862 RepID=A0A1I7WYV4_HETBA
MSDENQPLATAEGGKLSKKELNKLAKASKIAAIKAQKANLIEGSQQEEDEDVSVGMYGSYGLIQSADKKDITFTSISKISQDISGEEIWIRGRVHAIRTKGKTCFLVLRQRVYTAQVMMFVGEKISKQMLKFVSNIPKVSVSAKIMADFNLRL